MKKPSPQSGFTLVELLVSLALFTVIVVAAVGSLYTVNQAAVRVNGMRTVLDNLNFATEAMSRTIRTGQNIVCGGVNNQTGIASCAVGNSNGPGKEISLESTIDAPAADGTPTKIAYRWRRDNASGNNEIQKCVVVNNSVIEDNCVSMTAPEINIQRMDFYVNGADVGDGLQPGVMLIIQGEAHIGADELAPFSIQTFISQRAAE
ncbi:MAG: prepilin-type N-terminal cleavage/methylation domain-containing protein [Patescibacteria group bacterium]